MPPTTTSAAAHDLTRITLSVLSIAFLITASLWVLRPFVLPLVWAAIIVVSTWRLMLRIQAWLGGRRGAAVAVMTVVLLLVFFVPFYLAVSEILGESDRVVDLVHSLSTRAIPPPPPWLDQLPFLGERIADRWRELAALEPHQLADKLTPLVGSALGWFAARVGRLGSTLLSFLVTVLLSAVLYAKGEGATGELRRFFRRLSGERGDVIVTLAGKSIRAVALGVVVTAVVQTAVAGLGLVLVGFPSAGLISAVIFVLCIAQLGPILAMVPCVIWLYATGSPVHGTVLLIAALLGQTIDQVLRPLLIKKGGADLSLLVILAGVIGGLFSFGVIGLFVGPVILAVASTLLDGWITSGLGETAPQGTKASALGPVQSETGTSTSVPHH